MDSENKRQNLIDFLSGEKTLDMESFAKEVKQDKFLHQTLCDLDKVSFATIDKDQCWQGIVHELLVRRRRRLIRRWSVAASILLPVCCLSFYFFQKTVFDDNQIQFAKQESPQVQLFMADGEVLKLNELDTDTLIRKGNTSMRIEKERGLSYYNEEKMTQPDFHLLRVPRGNEYHLVLPDGTKVWLNSDSELKFPTSFTGGERKVFLQGEGYFDVVKDSEHPFRVVSDGMELEVLGTCFDVNTFRDDGHMIATLVEGSVKVRDTESGQECVLRPNQQVLLGEDGMKVRNVQANGIVAWMDGRFLFKELPLSQIAKQLERWFDIRIIFQDNSLGSHPFTGVIKRYDSLESIFLSIEETTNIRFELRNNVVSVCYRE